MNLRSVRSLALVIPLALAACGDSDDTDPAADSSVPATNAASATADDTTPPSTEATGDASAATYPVTIEHAMGSTTFDERPERIVSLNVQWTDALLAMGEEPRAYLLDAASMETEPYPWHVEALAGSTRIDSTGTVPYERIAALQPDLILVTYAGTEPGVFDTLQGIAPTIGMLGEREVDRWQDQVEVLGRILGDPQRADGVIVDVDAEIAALAEEFPGLQGKTYVSANYIPGDGINVVADPDDGASELFYRLGMEIAPDVLALDDEAVGRVEISLEQVNLLDADLVGILANGGDPSELPGWDQLRAVQSGAVFDLEFVDVVAINTPTPLSVPYVIDLLRPSLEAAAAA